MEGGHRAVIFDRFSGVSPNVSGEGTHFLIPWVQRPIIFDVRSRPRTVPVITGSKGMLLFLFYFSVLTRLQFYFPEGKFEFLRGCCEKPENKDFSCL